VYTDFVLPTNIIRDCDWTLMMCERILLQSLVSAAAAACRQLFCRLLGKYLLVSEFHNAHIIKRVFLTTIFNGSCMAVWVLRGSLFTQFTQFSCMAISWRHISQDRVATRLRFGGIFNFHSIANLSLSATLKEYWQELIRRWDSERGLLYDDNIHVEASAYAHRTDLLISTFYYKYLW